MKPNFFSRLGSALKRIEDAVLVSLLLSMIFMAVLQIVLRNFFDSGIVWGDALVRVLVLWIGLFGAMAASRTGNHISIDLISRYLPEGLKPFNRIMVYIFTLIITTLMTWHSARFVLMEKADRIMAFSTVPAWVCEAVIPVAFCVITLRYLTLLIQEVIRRP